MHALLVNPWIYDFKCHDFWIKPHGLLKIATMLKENNFTVDLIDCMDRFADGMENFKVKDDEYGKGKFYYEELSKPDVYTKIPRKYKRYGMPVFLFKEKLEKIQKPDIILVTSSMTYNYEGVFHAIDILKQKFESVKIILGGIYATLCSEHARKNKKISFVWNGAIEKTFFRVLKRCTGKIIEYEGNLNEVLPDYSFYKNTPYVAVRFTYGCPFDCTYCAIKNFYNGYYQREKQNIINELKKYFDSGIVDIALYDDALLHKNFYIKSILKDIIKENLNLRFHTPNGLHASYIDEELAKLLKESGFVDLRISLETSDYELQKKTGGKVSDESFKRAIKNLKKAGYNGNDIGVYILAGLPGQNYNSVLKDVNYLMDRKVKIKIANYSPIPGTVDFLRIKPEIRAQIATEPLKQNEHYFLTINTDYTWEDNEKIKIMVNEYNNSL